MKEESIDESTLKVRVRKYLSYFCDLVGFDIIKESQKKTRRINLSTYDIEKSLVQAHNLINTGKEQYALVVLFNISKTIFDGYKNSLSQDNIADNLDALVELTGILKQIKEDHTSFINNDFSTYLNSFAENKLFKKGEIKKDEFDPLDFLSVQDVLDNDRYLKTYSYQKGTSSLDELALNLSINHNLIISDSLHEWLTYLKANTKDDNVTYVSCLLKIEEREDLSYFIFSVQFKDHFWLCTDMVEFDNPVNRESTRNPRRHREGHYENLGLPYGLIDDLPKIRKKNTTLKVASAPNIEFFIYPIETLSAFSKIYIITLSGQLIQKVKRENSSLKQIMTFQDFAEQKLLASGPIEVDRVLNYKDSEGEDVFSNWDEENQRHITDLLGSINDNNSTSLVKADTSVITKSEHYDKDWLGTEERLQNLVRWTVLDEQKNSLQKKLEFTKAQVEADKGRLDSLINKEGNLSRLMPVLFSATNLFYDFKNIDQQISGFNNTQRDLAVDFCSEKHRSFSHFRLGLSLKELGKRQELYQEKWRNREMNETYDKFVFSPTCKCCNKTRAKEVKSIWVSHYKQLLFLCNLKDRSELPAYYRNYKFNTFIPYSGNSILNNVHPLSRLKDPCSQEHSGGIKIEVYTCGFCAKKLKKLHSIGENAILSEDGTITKCRSDKSKLSILP